MPRSWSFTLRPDSRHTLEGPVGLTLHRHGKAIATKTADKERDILEKKAWALAKSPFQMLLMTGLMLWMSGSSIQIFSIITLFMAVSQPVKALMSVKTVWAQFEGTDIDTLAPKMMWMALNVAGVALGVWRVGTMGLLPLTSADWLSMIAPKQAVEFSTGGVTGLGQ